MCMSLLVMLTAKLEFDGEIMAVTEDFCPKSSNPYAGQ